MCNVFRQVLHVCNDAAMILSALKNPVSMIGENFTLSMLRTWYLIFWRGPNKWKQQYHCCDMVLSFFTPWNKKCQINCSVLCSRYTMDLYSITCWNWYDEHNNISWQLNSMTICTQRNPLCTVRNVTCSLTNVSRKLCW